MIQKRRGIPVQDQEDIGYELGLIVPEAQQHHFRRVRTGPEPRAGYGTQTNKPEFSLDSYLTGLIPPLSREVYRPSDEAGLVVLVTSALGDNADVVLCFDSQQLFGDGDSEHVSLVDAIDSVSGVITLIDPAIGAQKIRRAAISDLHRVLRAHKVSGHGGVWVVREQKK